MTWFGWDFAQSPPTRRLTAFASLRGVPFAMLALLECDVGRTADTSAQSVSRVEQLELRQSGARTTHAGSTDADRDSEAAGPLRSSSEHLNRVLPMKRLQLAALPTGRPYPATAGCATIVLLPLALAL